MNIEDFIYSLAEKNEPKLEYFDFKGEVRKREKYDIYDSDAIFEFYQQYLREREKVSLRATRTLKSQIDAGAVKPGKSSSQLFRLESFDSRRHLVDEAEIFTYYRLKTIQPPAPKPKPPKQKIDLNPAKTFIYNNLIINNKEVLNKNEFITFILNELPNYHAKIPTLYSYYKKEFNNYHKHAPVMPAVEPDIMLKYPFRSKIDDYDEGFKKDGEWSLNISSVIIFGKIYAKPIDSHVTA